MKMGLVLLLSSFRRFVHVSGMLPILLLSILFVVIVCGCGTGKNTFNPYKKFSPQQLQQDYDLYRNILQERHPGLYWYTPKPLMDAAFAEGRSKLKDSLTEYDFRKILILANTNIQCGHTSVKASKKYIKYIDTLKAKPSFPLYIKTWNDTVVVVYNMYNNDSVLTRGVMIDSLNGLSTKFLLDTMRRYLNADGNNRVAKDQLLSTGTWFGSLYTFIYGGKNQYNIVYRDSHGTQRNTIIKPFVAKKDTTAKGKIAVVKKRKLSKKEKLQEARSLKIDSTHAYALISLNSFSAGLKLRSFFRQSFKQLRDKQIKNLIIDLRSNGGGRISNSNLLTKYLADRPFKTGDSLYAITRKSAFSKYIANDFGIKLFMLLSTKKKEVGKYHYTYYEKHFFKPRKRCHFSGQVYILSGGISFSASTLVMSALRAQPNVTIVGEPSGGAAYGNTAWQIPDVTLPNTKVRFRLPLFRLVLNKNLPKDGQGVLPEVWIGPTIEAIKNGKDYKMEKVKELLMN